MKLLRQSSSALPSIVAGAPVLAIPPFPGARAPQFAFPSAPIEQDVDAIVAALAKHRVGGCFWGSQPELARRPFVLDGTEAPLPATVPWPDGVDPWHLLARASEVRLPKGDSRGIIALAAGCNLMVVMPDGSERREDDIAALAALGITGWRWRNPFDGTDLTPLEAIELCGLWRRLIDSNRDIASVLGIADWKKPTVEPMLWGGAAVPFGAAIAGAGASVALWRSRMSQVEIQKIARLRPQEIEIEDGFIRSAGLGANCVPPQSILMDRVGVHFDPTAGSELEALIQDGHFSVALLQRAARLRHTVVRNGLSKYEGGKTNVLTRPGGDRLHVLVPGQVEDDRAVTSGLALPSNVELLRRARAEAGAEAYIIYKPHPDVVAGHRKGEVSGRELEALADRVEADAPMANLIELVDELHVNTSLAGFEALLRGKRVTVHGVPFYAGWGLTIDRGDVPQRRTTTRTLDELVAATLLLYPRYLDPVTGLPCPAEVLVERLVKGAPRLPARARAVVIFRKVLGRIKRMLILR